MINVIIADHQTIFCAGMAKVLAVEEDMRIIGQPQSAEHSLNALERLRPRILILSSSYLTILQHVEEITRERITSVLVLYDNTETASDFMRTGVQGVMYRSASGPMMVDAVRRLA